MQRRIDRLSPGVRWGVGCLIAAAALTGLAILVFLVAIALQPPTWLQVVLGVGLAIGGALLAWLVAVALGQSRQQSGEDTPFARRIEDRPVRRRR